MKAAEISLPSTAQAAFLIHKVGDHVAVAVQDMRPGPALAAHLDSGGEINVDVLEDIPLAHKIALQDLAEGVAVVEYGVTIGVTRRPIKRGQLVHVHNLRSARWK